MAHNNAELDEALRKGAMAIVHTVEGGHVLDAGLEDSDIDGRLARLGQLAESGVASLTIAHLFPNKLAGHTEGIPPKPKILGCHLRTGVEDDRGLTPRGEAVIKHMVELRMIPDVTHCTSAARGRVYELVGNRIPVIASHSGVHSLNPVRYNLEREDVEAIAASGGVVGVIFMPYWLDRANPGRGLDAIWQTMLQLREWSGSWDHVAIGTDFDGFTDPPDDCSSAGELPKVREMLEERGLEREDMEAVLGGNARSVLSAGWT
jgi:membrane dipeptidase